MGRLETTVSRHRPFHLLSSCSFQQISTESNEIRLDADAVRIEWRAESCSGERLTRDLSQVNKVHLPYITCSALLSPSAASNKAPGAFATPPTVFITLDSPNCHQLAPIGTRTMPKMVFTPSHSGHPWPYNGYSPAHPCYLYCAITMDPLALDRNAAFSSSMIIGES